MNFVMSMAGNRSPIEIKRNVVRSDRGFEDIFELVISNGTRIIPAQSSSKLAFVLYMPRRNLTGTGDVHIKVLESYPIIRIRPLQDRLEHDKVVPGHQPTLSRVCHAEERRKLCTADFRRQVRLGCDRVHELVRVEVPEWRAG